MGAGFESLSVRDLLEARDLYHNHLLGKPNVVGTAIGLYLIRDADEAARRAGRPHDIDHSAERRLDNARVQDYSWPCVLAFVREWLRPDQFGGQGQHRPDRAVPTRLYMPDGRIVPVCVVKVTPGAPADPDAVRPNWPDGMIGGGFPLLIEAQGAQRVASVGCLVTDGHTIYALTNRHVSGGVGDPVYTRLRGKQTRVGRASARQLTRRPFAEIYPDYPGLRCYSALDVGLVELDDVAGWTSQIYGLGELGELADLNEQTISLRLIGAPVMAFGAASGPLDGRIAALFYRYKSVGGFDWIADFMIAPAGGDGPQTRPGDSGTVWCLPAGTDSRGVHPLAVEWGGQTLLGPKGTATLNIALATSLSSVCNRLNVDVVTDHNSGARPYWGSEGHYTIAALACQQVSSDALGSLMRANADRIAFDVANLSPDEIKGALKQAKDNVFIPLADVPDIVWKQSPQSVRGGRDTQFNAATHRATGPEHPTHYADVDLTRPSDGKSLLALCLADPANTTVPFWQAFYDAAGMTEPANRGLLPFRCWQFFDAMVAAVRAGDRARFVCAAGILSHYVGDACQPLHGSVFSDGYPDNPTVKTVRHRDGTSTDAKVRRGAGVHSAYEEAMIDAHAADLHAMMSREPAHQALPMVAGGQAAAQAILALMDRTARTIPPKALVDAYIAAGGGKSRRVIDLLWQQFGAKTGDLMADGAAVLATLWDSAWQVGGGIRDAGGAVDEAALHTLYQDPDFVPSLDLDHIAQVLGAEPAVVDEQPTARPHAPAKAPRKTARKQAGDA